MRKIRVLHVLTTTTGGLGQSVLSIILGLDPERFDVTVSFGPGYAMDHRFEEKGIRIIPVRMKRGLSAKNILGFWDLYMLFQRECFDIVHAHSSIAGILARLAARLSGVPLILFTLHGYATLDYRRTPLRPLLWIAEKLLDRCTDYYVAICGYVERTWIQRGIVKTDRVTIIYNGVDPESICGNINYTEKRKSLSLPSNAPVMGTIGLLERQKGTEFLIRAIPKILGSFPECKFIIVGDGPLYSNMKNLARQLVVLPQVQFLGWRDDATELIGIMDIFCLPSLREGFSVALLEAMAHGKPIIATSVAGNPEAVIDGETGLLIPPKDEDALAEAVLYFLNYPEIARHMGQKGRARLIERFTVKKMQQEYQSLYLKLLQEKSTERE